MYALSTAVYYSKYLPYVRRFSSKVLLADGSNPETRDHRKRLKCSNGVGVMLQRDGPDYATKTTLAEVVRRGRAEGEKKLARM